MTESAAETARAYYEAIDAQRYDRFAELLVPGVVHERPDRTFEGRETLVEFMRDGRPSTNTSHEIDAVYTEQAAPHEQAALNEQAAPRGDLPEVA
uniref:nuclear transport factor 2 family protein n=1 Tax=Halorussus litoreus TaxID=1710536 RepID=UPI0013006A3B